MFLCLQVGETFDWRLSVANMERRDHYFSLLQRRIESLHEVWGEKARPVDTHQTCTAAMPHDELGATFARVISSCRQDTSALQLIISTLVPHSLQTATQKSTMCRAKSSEKLLTEFYTIRHHALQAMVVAHSFGEVVFRNFLAWVERREPGWTELHIAVFANIAGPVFGVPKVSCCLMFLAHC